MRVLQVGKYYPPHRGGMETHLADLCRQIKDSVDLRVLVAHSGKGTFQEDVDGVPVTRLGTPLTILANPVTPGLVSHIKRAEADIIHLHWPNPLGLLAYLLSGTSAKLVITYHSDIVRQKITGALFEPILRRALAQAAIIVTSPNYASSSPVLRAFPAQCRTVPLGIDCRTAQAADSELVREARKRFGPNMVLATGRHIYYKGFHHLIDAMKEVDGHLVLAGDGPLRPQFAKQIRELGMENKVTLAGQISDERLRAYYHACSVFVLPSTARSEAFGLVQLEAMAAGKPVINTAIDSGVPYVSLHEKTGLTVDPGDSRQLAQALRLILSNERARVEYGAAARQRVLQHFSLEAMASRTLDIYREVLEQDRPSIAAATAH